MLLALLFLPVYLLCELSKIFIYFLLWSFFAGLVCMFVLCHSKVSFIAAFIHAKSQCEVRYSHLRISRFIKCDRMNLLYLHLTKEKEEDHKNIHDEWKVHLKWLTSSSQLSLSCTCLRFDNEIEKTKRERKFYWRFAGCVFYEPQTPHR